MSRDGRDRAAALYAAGVTASSDMRPALGARRLRAALRALPRYPPGDPRDDARLRSRILISLAFAVSELGDVDLGLSYLDDAEQLLAPQHRGVLYGQRAVLLRRTGRDDEALEQYDLALGVLDERDEPRDLARVLMNRGVLYVRSSRAALARADLDRAVQVAQRHGFSLIAAKAGHNLAMLDLAAGDLPKALGAFAALAEEYSRTAAGVLPVLSLDRARVLLAAGLFREADEDLAVAHAQLRAQGMGQDEGEALLARAEAALLALRPPDARRWAKQAKASFVRRKNRRFAALAELVDLRAVYAGVGGSAVLVRKAQTLADRLAELGLDEDARVAGLLATRALAACEQLEHAAQSLNRFGTMRRGDRLDTRVLCRLTRAEVAGATGRAQAADRQLAIGLAELHRYRAQFGCLDLQTGAAVHGRDLAVTGLRKAIQRGVPAAVFRWSERSRAQALLLPAVRPPADPHSASALQQLRQLRLAVREAERAGRPVARLRARCATLERQIRHRSWSAVGDGGSTKSVSMRAVADALTEAAMVIYVRDGDSLRALVLTGDKARIVTAGDAATAEEMVLRLRASLDALAGRQMPDRLAAAILASIRRDAKTLSDLLLAPVLPIVGDRDLVIVPTGGLLTAPWSLLPGCAGRPLTVAASATGWYAAREREPAARSVPARVVLIVGPGNDRADAEVRQVAKLYPGATVLAGASATAGATLAAIDGAGIVHVAAHGSHQGENPLFSALDLADGPLMGYDLQQLAAPPGVAVLSTCDLGLSEIRPGDESVGMSSALIAAGTATVIASVSRIGDDVAIRVMTDFHQRLAAGTPPAVALARAAGDPTGFVCFGAG